MADVEMVQFRNLKQLNLSLNPIYMCSGLVKEDDKIIKNLFADEGSLETLICTEVATNFRQDIPKMIE